MRQGNGCAWARTEPANDAENRFLRRGSRRSPLHVFVSAARRSQEVGRMVDDGNANGIGLDVDAHLELALRVDDR